MEVAVRSYLAAGVAVVGATSIALAPVEVLPPDFQIRGERMVAVLEDVSLSSLADLIADAQAAWAPIGGAVDSASQAAQAAILGLSGALEAALVEAAGQDTDAFQAVVDGLLDGGSVLATAIDNAIANFPSPEAFVDAMVSAFASVNLDLADAIEVALEVALQLGIGLDAGTIGEALLNAGTELAAAFNTALAAFPNPQEFVAAFEAALGDVIPGFNAVATAAAEAFTDLSGQLAATIEAGLAAGVTAFDALVEGLLDSGGDLAAVFNAALAAFPSPAAFIDALADAFGAVDVDLGAALDVALAALVDLGIDIDAGAIAESLIEAGADLAAAFGDVFDGFPAPGDFFAAFNAAITGALPGLNTFAQAAAESLTDLSGALATAVNEGAAAGIETFDAIVGALQDTGSGLSAALAAAIEAFPTPRAFVDTLVQAFAAIDVDLGDAVRVALGALINIALAPNPVGIAAALIEAAPELAAVLEGEIAGYPTPAEFFSAFNTVIVELAPGFNAFAAGAAEAFTELSSALSGALEDGFAAGLDAFETVVAGLQDAGSGLAAALAAAIEPFPTPGAFVDALVSAFGAIDVDLGAALDVALAALVDLGVDLDPGAIADAFLAAGSEFAALVNGVLDDFPTPGDFITAFNAALEGVVPGFDAVAAATAEVIAELSDALTTALETRLAAGVEAFDAVVAGLLDAGSELAAAFNTAIEAFPTPEAFIDALVSAFGAIDVDLAGAIDAALEVFGELGLNLDATAIGEALAAAGEELGAIFDAALEDFSSPAEFVAAFESALERVIPGLTALADATETAIGNFSSALSTAIDAGLAVGETAFEAFIVGLQDAGGQLAAAFEAALGAFPTPETFLEALVDAFAAIDVDLGLSLEAALELIVDLNIDLDAGVIADALLNAGAELAAAFDAAFEDFPTPADLVAAVERSITAFAPGFNAIADATAEAIGNVSAALTAAIQSGIGIGSAAFGDFLQGLVAGGGTLAAAFEAALENLPSPAVFIRALVDASASLGTVLADLGASVEAGLEAGLDLGAAALQGFADVGADISAAIGASLEGLPTPAEFVESFAEAGEQFGAAADAVTQIGVDAVDNVAAATDAVVEAFRATAVSALENGNDALQAIGAGIYAATQALAEAASDVNIGGAISAAIGGAIGGGLGGFGDLRGEAVGDVTKRDEGTPTVTSAEVDPSAVTEISGTPNQMVSLNANSPAEGQATQQTRVMQGQVQLREALDTAGKQVNEGLDQTRKNLKGAADQTRENLKGAADQTRKNLKGAADQTRENLKGAADQTRKNLKGAADQTRENLKGAAEQTRKNVDGVRKNVKSAVGGDKKSSDRSTTENKKSGDSEPSAASK
ncbi:hypothetical protein MDOR_28420 [Mycolicibacterium doricum]|uniref:Uncharacterized protein n=1 Tax=Mycolicibacterium doricum TaxID=126673 RepID=A0A1X1TF60_9MYCO|nr:hypothetical protein [Mycolicibacterium doricum]MCV7268387.1 apolipoprotein A1/A4/E family protein [Mycolicibacterium doricum]ORV43195.1 hypothetical protein AWC01_06775 [Mycolicibacterium doricum]BBZ08673.1 hypothetical protein MDOR_28420 [Mycolicibacterium doricum]